MRDTLIQAKIPAELKDAVKAAAESKRQTVSSFVMYLLIGRLTQSGHWPPPTKTRGRKKAQREN